MDGEILDSSSGVWTPLQLVERCRDERDWSRYRFSGRQFVPNKAHAARLKATVIEAAKPDADILDVSFVCNGERRYIVQELQPFEIEVKLRFNRAPETADIGLKLTRADGVYAFWQSSGMVGQNR